VSFVFPRVYALLAQVPPGKVVTYGQLARALGMPNGARTVGWAMRQCPEGLPWHRVVNSQGYISHRGRGDSEALQRSHLEDDGVVLSVGGRIDLKRYGWHDI